MLPCLFTSLFMTGQQDACRDRLASSVRGGRRAFLPGDLRLKAASICPVGSACAKLLWTFAATYAISLTISD